MERRVMIALAVADLWLLQAFACVCLSSYN
jgi:hypothetical protein